MKKKLYLLSTFTLALFVSPFIPSSFAQTICGADEVATDLGCLPTEPVPFVEKFYGWGLGLISFVAIIFLIIGGYYIMTSHGNPEAVNKGKSFIFYSIAGVLLAVFGFVFIQIVTGDILKIPGFN